MIPNAPCLNCRTRKAGCHSDCTRYIFAKIKERKQKQINQYKNQVKFAKKRLGVKNQSNN